jgi:ArsR family transcriptional regulator
MGQSKVSRHLAHLRNAGLVNDRRVGVWVYYVLAEPTGRLHRRVIGWLREGENEIPVASADLRALDNVRGCADLCPENSRAKTNDCEGDVAVTST